MQFPKNSSTAGTSSSPPKWQWNLSHYLFGRIWKKTMSLLKLAAGSCCNRVLFLVFTIQSVASLKGEDDILPPVVWSNTHPEGTPKISYFNLQLQRNRDGFAQPGAYSQYFLDVPSYAMRKKKKMILTIWHLTFCGCFFLSTFNLVDWISLIFICTRDTSAQCDSPYHTVPWSLNIPQLFKRGEYCLPYDICWSGRAPSCSQNQENPFFLYNCILHSLFFMQWGQTLRACPCKWPKWG